MNKKVTRNILKILLVIQVILTVLPSFILASEIMRDPIFYMPKTPTGGTTVIEKTNAVMKVISVIGAIVSVIALMVLGIKFMFGSIEQRAEYKKIFLPYILGTILIFTIPTLIRITFNLMRNIGIATYSTEDPGSDPVIDPNPDRPWEGEE